MNENLADPVDRPVVEGSDFLRQVQAVAELCAEHTDHHFPHMGKAVPELLEHLGTVLSQLYRMGTCSWGCAGGDHVVEYMVGRSCSTALATLSLMRCGYYDEALALTRNVGEAANLLTLFNRDALSFQKWRSATERVRKNEFAPVKVRLALENIGLNDLGLVREERYRQLSHIRTHLSPGAKPQAYNALDLPTLGTVFQDLGVVVILNELGTAVGFLAIPAARLLAVPPDRWKDVKESVINLLASVGGIHAVDLDRVKRLIREASNIDTPH